MIHNQNKISYDEGHHPSQSELFSFDRPMARNVRETSLEAYEEIQDSLPQRNQMVYAAIRLHPNKTDMELSKILGFKDPNMVRPRRHELYKESRVVCSGKTKCSITKKKAYTWRIA